VWAEVETRRSELMPTLLALGGPTAQEKWPGEIDACKDEVRRVSATLSRLALPWPLPPENSVDMDRLPDLINHDLGAWSAAVVQYTQVGELLPLTEWMVTSATDRRLARGARILAASVARICLIA